jgi:hypothetical protein
MYGRRIAVDFHCLHIQQTPRGSEFSLMTKFSSSSPDWTTILEKIYFLCKKTENLILEKIFSGIKTKHTPRKHSNTTKQAAETVAILSNPKNPMAWALKAVLMNHIQ